jgi:hypothetical protein
MACRPTAEATTLRSKAIVSRYRGSLVAAPFEWGGNGRQGTRRDLGGDLEGLHDVEVDDYDFHKALFDEAHLTKTRAWLLKAGRAVLSRRPVIRSDW